MRTAVRTCLLLGVAAALVLAKKLGHLKPIQPLIEQEQSFFSIPKGLSRDQRGMSMKDVFGVLFPFESPAWNSVLATFYISSAPNFILLAVPSNLDPTSLNTMIAFATGGLLGDVFLHLVPHAFFGEGHEEGFQAIVVVEQKRNIVIGSCFFVGFMAFFVLDKTMRVLSARAGDDGGHSHSHSHSHSHADNGASIGKSSAVKGGELRNRKTTTGSSTDIAVPEEKAVNPSLKLSAYLNLFGDFTHNITDGLAMAASFYSSPSLGAVTTIATFAHEIPHEIADYSILIKSGFTKSQALGSQFFTALGAFLGTFLGIWIAETSGAANQTRLAIGQGFFGTSVGAGELVIPMTAGGFLYIASVSVVPELLAESRSATQALKEYGAMAFGVFCMAIIAWNE